ncbi:hypothetical protein NQ314_007819 [Rhamnusium bicolor]|uniref:Uncharacterized protein n=1 Tax=Rhamnusium bicolor TaxID=1586634 RepID=A0AAV8YH82_9CUCU|nr:hypothetical protein NQ314_007819 [Rhamnusium bicolor]
MGAILSKQYQMFLAKSNICLVLAHTLDLVASNIVYETESVKDIVSKIKSIVTHFKQCGSY